MTMNIMFDMEKVKEHFHYKEVKSQVVDAFSLEDVIVMMMIEYIEQLEGECERQKTNRWQNYDLAVARKLEIQELRGQLKYAESKLMERDK
jgi:hypothetical protein